MSATDADVRGALAELVALEDLFAAIERGKRSVLGARQHTKETAAMFEDYQRRRPIALANACAALAAQPAAPSENTDVFSAPLHPNTDDLVNRFAAALKRKLSLAEQKYGYSDGWMRKDWMDECRQHLMEHIAKGDPRDVAAYCAFLWHHGESTAAPSQPAAEPPSELAAATRKWIEYERDYILPCFKWAAEVGYDLQAAVRDNPGKNCVQLLVEHLRSLAAPAPSAAAVGPLLPALEGLRSDGKLGDLLDELEVEVRCETYNGRHRNRGSDAVRKEIDELLGAALATAPQAAVREPTWRPMKTAPKDGTAVLVLVEGSDIPHAARWISSADSMHFVEGMSPPGWHLTWDSYRIADRDGPRYWMPCPDDPDEATAPHPQPGFNGAALEPQSERTAAAIAPVVDASPDVAPPNPQPAPSEALTDSLRGLDTSTRVRFYEHDFYVLSNFSAFALEWKGRRFDTSEAAYHWEKFVGNPALMTEVQYAPSAHEAFKIAERNKAERRPDWDDVKVDIMLDILRAKAEQHEYVRRKLLATGDRELVEDSWRDDFWGWGPNRDGKNMLGRLWMQVRAELLAAGRGE